MKPTNKEWKEIYSKLTENFEEYHKSISELDNTPKLPDIEFRKCQGKCLKCDSEEIEYGSTDVDGQELSYDYECKDCGHWGKEWYSMEYIETR